ncbi:hypothetical protein HK44_002095 [Pseudomonas fluorescens HK44]|uniref:Uncharacterized protein n=1 Tax=Pseudomonas fluorescens HK44 TaxID=1042209 RepID=A0A010TAK3_PSEFL|nr:hypothetical protein HK44_002095 [Pseudomonas fluorescens HK44]
MAGGQGSYSLTACYMANLGGQRGKPLWARAEGQQRAGFASTWYDAHADSQHDLNLICILIHFLNHEMMPIVNQ